MTVEGASAGRSARVWQVLLLLPQPPLALVHLFLVRAERVAPSFVPVVVLALLPVASFAIGVRRWVVSPPPRGGSDLVLLGVALLEVAWAVLAAAMVGFAIAWRSG